MATTDRSEATTNTITSFYEDFTNLTRLRDFLRGRHGPSVSEGLLLGTHVYYLKGETLVNFLWEPKNCSKWPSNFPRCSNRHEAILVCKELCKRQFLLRSEIQWNGELDVSCFHDFDESGYFVWVDRGPKHRWLSVDLYICFFFVLFPIWPQFLRVFVWYTVVTLLSIFVGLIIASQCALGAVTRRLSTPPRRRKR